MQMQYNHTGLLLIQNAVWWFIATDPMEQETDGIIGLLYLKNDKALHKGGCFKVKVELI